jgi:hypothetical protein
MQLVPTTQPLVTQFTTIPSSVASKTNKVHYLVDNIDRSVACSLVITYGVNNHRTREVAVGLVIPGCKYHECDIPEDYCKVEVSTVVQGYEDDMLDILVRRALRNLDRLSRTSSFGLDETSS